MSQLIQSLRQHLPENQIIVDDLRRLAYGTDASFYRPVSYTHLTLPTSDLV